MMNLRLFIKTFITSASILCVISLLIFSSIKDEEIPDKPKAENDAAENASNISIVPEDSELSHYLIKLEGSKVNIYEIYSDNTKVQSGTLDISVGTLREADRESFEKGIILKTASDILHIAEDFSS